MSTGYLALPKPVKPMPVRTELTPLPAKCPKCGDSRGWGVTEYRRETTSGFVGLYNVTPPETFEWLQSPCLTCGYKCERDVLNPIARPVVFEKPVQRKGQWARFIDWVLCK